jgi:hypothetical protein
MMVDAVMQTHRILDVAELPGARFGPGRRAGNAFEMRYQKAINPDKDCWQLCSRVSARRDNVNRLSAPW